MSRKTLPRSVRLSAAASVVACTAGLAGESADAAPVWIDVPSFDGTITPVLEPIPGTTALDPDYDMFEADFDNDGKVDFYFIYYFRSFDIRATSNPFVSSTPNPDADILHARFSQTSTTWLVTPSVFGTRDEAYSFALTYDPIPRPVSLIYSGAIENQFDSRSFFAGLFKGGDGNTYVGYLDLELTNNGDPALDFMTIHDAGYALIPEPSSLALLGLGGLLLARRRRG